MVRGGFKRCNDDISGDANDFQMKISINKLHEIWATSDESLFIKKQQENYAAHLIRTEWSRNCFLITTNIRKLEDQYLVYLTR